MQAGQLVGRTHRSNNPIDLCALRSPHFGEIEFRAHHKRSMLDEAMILALARLRLAHKFASVVEALDTWAESLSSVLQSVQRAPCRL